MGDHITVSHTFSGSLLPQIDFSERYLCSMLASDPLWFLLFYCLCPDLS